MMLVPLIVNAAVASTPDVSLAAMQQRLEPAERPPRVEARADDPWGVRDRRFGPRMGDWELTLSGSGFTDRDFTDSTYGVNFTIGHFLTDNLEIAFRQNIDFTDVGPSDFRGMSRVAADWHFDFGRFQPFIGGSVGGIYGDRGESGIGGPEAGIKWFVHPQTFILGMAEYQFFFRSSDDFTGRTRRDQLVFTLGIGFLF